MCKFCPIVELLRKLNNRMEDIVSERRRGFALPPEAAANFRESCNGMLVLQAKVARHFAENGIQLFNVTSKCHLVQHLALMSDILNPQVIWCFAGEDMMQKAQRMAQAACRGVKPWQVCAKMAEKYRLALHLRFTAHERQG